MHLYMRKSLGLCFALLIACHFIPASAVANGQVPTLKKLPQTVPNREQLQKLGFNNIDLAGIYFGEMSVQGNKILLDNTYPFDINKLKSSYISLFSASGFVCNVKINSFEEKSEGPDLSSYYATESTFTTDCLKEYSNLPKYSHIAFIYPALDMKKIKKINPTIAERDQVLIKHFIPTAIKEFANNTNINIKNESTAVTKIGEKGLTKQYFVYSFSTAGGYSLILAINSGKIALQRIDNGVLSNRVLFDINYDGLADAFVFEGGVVGGDYTYGYRIIFDGEKWLGGLISTPM